MQIYDTTLRDGTQGEGVSLSAEDKLRLARHFDSIGIHFIEGGWPGSNPKDMAFFGRAEEELSLAHAQVAAFGSTRRKNMAPDEDPQVRMLVDAHTPIVTLFGKSSAFQVHEVLRTDMEENLRMIGETVGWLVESGREVIYDAEHFFDGYADDPEYALATLTEALDNGSRTLVLCDTNGGRMPWEIAQAVAHVRGHFGFPAGLTVGEPGAGDPFILGIHAHDDSGCGVANTLEAVRAGAMHVQGTVNGYGERCGNANLISILANLQLKMGLAVLEPENLARLSETSHVVSELANMSPVPHQPYVGSSAFAHKGGTHVNAVVKTVDSYQHVDPEVVGNSTRVLISELSGKDNIAVKRRQFGLDNLGRTEERAVLARIKELENLGFAFEAAEASVELMLRREMAGYAAPFELVDFMTIVENRQGRGILAEAMVKLRIAGQEFHEAGEGNGPVNAMDVALRKALLKFYPELERVSLLDYKVRILDSHSATAATTRVLIASTDGDRIWNTVGASPNIMEASWTALTDSLEYFLLSNRDRT